MLLPLLIAAAAFVPAPQSTPPAIPQRATAVRDSSAPDSVKDRDIGRRLPVTAAVLATAFRNADTRALFEKARRARLEQDSSIKSYDAMSRERMSVNLGIGRIGREHLFFRRESAARVRWQHDVGAVVDLTGARSGIPMAPKEEELKSSTDDLSYISPIPYFPGMETLWIVDNNSARVEANDRSIVNPLTVGAEAYYTYAISDSASFRLQNGATVRLREIEVRPRQPKWNLAVGSFWFDDQGHLVKAAYRLSVPLNIWEMVAEENDSSDQVPKIVQGLVSPLRMQITGIAIEYALMQGRFWLPRMRSMTGDAQFLFARVPMSVDQRFEYRSVNTDLGLAIDTTKLPQYEPWGPRPREWRDSVRRADSTRRAAIEAMTPEQRAHRTDSLRQRSDSISRRSDSTKKARDRLYKAVADSLERGLPAVGAELLERGGSKCDSAGVSTRYIRRFAARMPVLVRVPCNVNTLVTSPDLPPSIYDKGEELFSTKDRDEMFKEALSLADQAPFSLSMRVLPPATYSFGMPMTRFNRVEGFSTGISVDQQFGAGLSAGATGRIGSADKAPNIELNVKRSNLSKTIGISGYHRLVVANDWGNPLSFGSSFSALMFGKDEGFYYRTTGAELSWTKGINSKVEWRAFAERQRSVPVNTQLALVHRSSTDTFPANIDAANGAYYGSGLRLVHNHGLDPRGFRTFTDFRLEGAVSDSFYARGSAELNLSRGVPLFHTTLGMTLSGGSSLGYLPPQRRWYLGGTHTVRGQDADTAFGGNAYALTRVELAKDYRTYRSSIFADAGWAGSRDHLALNGRLLTGVGYGQSMFDGILRWDISRGLQPRKQWRFDVYLEARF